MRFEQFSDKHKNLNLQRDEIIRKWRILQEEEEQRMLFEAASKRLQGQAPTPPPFAAQPPVTTGVSSQLMMIYERGATTYTYYVFDYDNNSIVGPTDTGISIEDYPLNDSSQYIINGGGYCHRFYNPGNNDFILLFIGATGNIIETIIGNTGDLSVYTLDGRYIVAWDYDLQTIWIFDGNKVTTDTTTFADVDYYAISSNWNNTTSEGFLMESSTEEESGDVIKKLYLGTIDGFTEIYSATIPSGSNLFFDFYGSSFSDKCVVKKYNNDFYLGFTIIDSTGSIIQDITLDDEIYRTMDLQRFGTNKFYAIFYDGTDVDIDYEIYVYDGTNNNLLHKTLEYGTSYTNKNSYYDVRSISNFSDYNFSENLMFAFYHPTGYQGYNLDEVDYCKLIGFFEGESDFVEYDFADNETKYIRFIEIKTTELFLLPYDEVGSFSFLIFNKNGTSSFATPTSSGDQDQYSIVGTSVGTKCFLRYDDISSSVTKFYMVSTDGSQFILLDEEISSWSTSIEFDTVIVRDNTNQLAWYFNSLSTNWTNTDYFLNYNTPTSYSNDTNLSNGNIVAFSSNRLYYFNDMGESTYIYDGGDDMYDDANYLNTDLGTGIPYTHTQMNLDNDSNEAKLSDFIMDGEIVSGDGTNFGVGSSYFTNLYPGLFVMMADSIDITEFYIDGDIGADGGGDYGSLTYTPTGYEGTYKAYIKKIWNANDPTINHIFIVNTDGTGITHDPNDNTYDDYNSISGIGDVSTLHYLLFAKADGTETTETEFQNVINSYLNIVDDKTITNALADLNTNYATITDNLPPQDNLGDSAIYTRTNVTNLTLSSYQDLDCGKDIFALWYYDSERDNKITLKLYNYSGTLLQTLETEDYDVNEFDVVANRVYFQTYTKYFDPEVGQIYFIKNFHHITTSNKTTITKTLPDENNLYYAINDWVWWD